jgi:hypothetical protein
MTDDVGLQMAPTTTNRSLRKTAPAIFHKVIKRSDCFEFGQAMGTSIINQVSGDYLHSYFPHPGFFRLHIALGKKIEKKAQLKLLPTGREFVEKRPSFLDPFLVFLVFLGRTTNTNAQNPKANHKSSPTGVLIAYSFPPHTANC